MEPKDLKLPDGTPLPALTTPEAHQLAIAEARIRLSLAEELVRDFRVKLDLAIADARAESP